MIEVKSKRNIFLVLLIISIPIYLIIFDMAEASRRVLTLNDVMEQSIIRSRNIEINGKIYDIWVNHAEKSIKVRGATEDFEDEERIRKYFRHRGPSDYQVNYEISILY